MAWYRKRHTAFLPLAVTIPEEPRIVPFPPISETWEDSMTTQADAKSERPRGPVFIVLLHPYPSYSDAFYISQTLPASRPSVDRLFTTSKSNRLLASVKTSVPLQGGRARSHV